jgi:hypothetical protein
VSCRKEYGGKPGAATAESNNEGFGVKKTR